MIVYMCVCVCLHAWNAFRGKCSKVESIKCGSRPHIPIFPRTQKNAFPSIGKTVPPNTIHGVSQLKAKGERARRVQLLGTVRVCVFVCSCEWESRDSVWRTLWTVPDVCVCICEYSVRRISYDGVTFSNYPRPNDFRIDSTHFHQLFNSLFLAHSRSKWQNFPHYTVEINVWAAYNNGHLIWVTVVLLDPTENVRAQIIIGINDAYRL